MPRQNSRNQTNDPKAPWGYKKDGTPRKKTGRHALPPSMKKPKKKHTPARKSRSVKGDHILAGKVSRGGFKKNGEPMPSTHDDRGCIRKGSGAVVQRGRPVGSVDMDRILRGVLRSNYGESDETIAHAMMRTLMDRALESPKSCLAITRFATERTNGKPVQPTKDLTPGRKFIHIPDEKLDALIAAAGEYKPDEIPAEENAPSPTPAPRQVEPPEPETRPAKTKDDKKDTKTSGKRGT